MTAQKLAADIKDATDRLLELARSHCWNEISGNCVYVLSEIQNQSTDNFFERRRLRKRENEKKNPMSLDLITHELRDLFANLYDINLMVYKATKDHTVVEIQYYPKSSLDKEYANTVMQNEPMLHCKVALPPYADGKTSKFDINWELGGLKHKWNLFWWHQRTRNEIKKRKT